MATVVGVPKEIKDMEGRVSMQPDGVTELVHHGHEVVVQSGAGGGAGFTDEEYEAAGARLVDGPEEVFSSADLIVKVKEPVPEEYDRFREGQQLFTYLHLAADKGLTEFLMDKKIDSIAYETVELPDGSLPLLTPMREGAGARPGPQGEEDRPRRVRAGGAARRGPAAAHPDERGGGQDGRAGGGAPPGEPQRRGRAPARGRAGDAGGEGYDHRRRHLGDRGGEDKPGHAGDSEGARHQPQEARGPLRALWGAGGTRGPA